MHTHLKAFSLRSALAMHARRTPAFVATKRFAPFAASPAPLVGAGEEAAPDNGTAAHRCAMRVLNLEATSWNPSSSR